MKEEAIVALTVMYLALLLSVKIAKMYLEGCGVETHPAQLDCHSTCH